MSKTTIAERFVHGDIVLYRLLSQIGCMMEAFMGRGKPDVDNWYFWMKDLSVGQADSGKADMEADRLAAIGKI